jgi:hypothetical protein
MKKEYIIDKKRTILIWFLLYELKENDINWESSNVGIKEYWEINNSRGYVYDIYILWMI